MQVSIIQRDIHRSHIKEKKRGLYRITFLRIHLDSLVNKLKPGTIKQVGQRDLSFIKVDLIKWHINDILKCM
jgi:hypothetical protein